MFLSGELHIEPQTAAELKVAAALGLLPKQIIKMPTGSLNKVSTGLSKANKKLNLDPSFSGQQDIGESVGKMQRVGEEVTPT